MGSDNETRNKTHPLLGKSFVNMNNTGSIARERTRAAKEGLFEAVFSVRSVERLYNEKQLRLRE
jgi:hypothetical protein